MQAKDQKFYADLEETLKGRLAHLDTERKAIHQTAERFGVRLEGEDEVKTPARRAKANGRRPSGRRSGLLTREQARSAIWKAIKEEKFESLGWAMRTLRISESTARRALEDLLNNGSITRHQVGYNLYEYEAAPQLVA